MAAFGDNGVGGCGGADSVTVFLLRRSSNLRSDSIRRADSDSTCADKSRFATRASAVVIAALHIASATACCNRWSALCANSCFSAST